MLATMSDSYLGIMAAFFCFNGDWGVSCSGS